MKKASSLFLALGIASAALSSCSRSDYAFKTNTPTSLGSEPTKVAATKPADSALATEAVVVAHAAKPAVAPAAAVAPVATAAPVAAAPQTQGMPNPAIAATPAVKAIKPTLVQRLALKSLTKQVAKLQNRKQATASTEQTASKAGKSAIYAAIGLALLILGVVLAASGSLGIGIVLYVVGGILFTVFGIIALVYLISGK